MILDFASGVLAGLLLMCIVLSLLIDRRERCLLRAAASGEAVTLIDGHRYWLVPTAGLLEKDDERPAA